jgi:hypothetical protein
MNRSELAHLAISEKLSEIEMAIRFIWFRTSIENRNVTDPSDIYSFFEEEGISQPNRARLRARLAADRRVLNSRHGFRLRLSEVKRLDEIHIKKSSGNLSQILIIDKLLLHAEKINNENEREFVIEAIECLKSRSYRASILMAWSGSLAVLQRHVFDNFLNEFNSDAMANNLLKKPVSNILDMRDGMKDSHFLDVIRRISLIDDSIKRSLKSCLDLRNNCAHPSEFRIGESAVFHCIENLLMNVFDRFSVR